MANYTRVHNFTVKDALDSGDPDKVVRGSEVDAEFNAIVTAIASKYDADNRASEAQAQAGTSNDVLMTPLRTADWYAARTLAGLSVLGRSANTTGAQAAITGTDGQVLRVSGTALGFGTIDAAAVGSGAFHVDRIPSLDTAKITSGTFANARIAQGNVTQHQAALALATSQITSGTFADARIAQSNVTQHQAALALAASQTTSGAFADARIPNLAASKITSGEFATARIADAAITRVKLGAGAVKAHVATGGQITVSTSDPSGGTDGDIWLKV